MSENNFMLKIQAILDKVRSIANIKADIKAIEPKLPKIKIQGTLDSAKTKREFNTKLKTITPKIKVDADTSKAVQKIKNLKRQKTTTTIQPTVDNSKMMSGLKQAQKEAKSLFDKFINSAIGVNLVRISVQKVTQAIYQAIAAVKELDTIKTNIQMVSKTSDSEVDALMSSYNTMAKELSSTTKAVSEASNEFLRMGESIETTNELIKSSQILSKTGMIESAEAASYLISSLKGYQIEANNSISVVDKLTAVDLNAAVSAGGLAEAISRCSNIANNSGTSMDRLIGYAAAIGEVTQESMSVVGNSLKSMYSRMSNIKIGRYLDDETGESLSDTEAVLNKLGIQLRDTEDTYRNFDDVLNDIGTRWKSLTQVEQNSLSVAMAGTMQRERFTVLMNNWSNALKYSEVATNSAGSALERYGVYQDSLEAKTNELTAAIESLSTNTVSEELYSGIIQATTGIVEFLDKTNLLKSTLAGLVAMGISKAFVSMGAGIVMAYKSTAQLTVAMALFDNGKSVENLNNIGIACKGLSNQQLRLVLSTKSLLHEERLQILEGMGVAETEQEQTLATLGLAVAEDKATASSFSLKGALNTLKTAIATNPLGMIVTVVTTATVAFSWLKQAYDALTVSVEEANEAMNEAISEYESAKSSLEGINSELAEQTQKMNELLAKDKLTYAEKGQLEELQAITKELLLQQDIEEKNTEKAAKEAAEKTIDAYDKQYGDYDISKDAVEDYSQVVTGSDIINLNDDNVSYNIALLSKYKDMLAETEEKLADTSKLNDTEIEWLKDDKQDYIDGINTISDSLDTALSDLEEKRLALEDGYNIAVRKQINGETLTTTDKETIDRYNSIYDAIKLIYEYTNQNAWNNMEISDIFNTKGIEKTKEELIEMAQAGELTPETIEGYTKLNDAIQDSELFLKDGQTAAEAFCDEINACAGAAGKMTGALNKNDISFTDAVSQIQSLSEGFDQLDKIYADVYDKGDFDWSSILNNEDFSNTFSGFTEEYNDFIQTISNSPSDIEACQESFNRLASAYLNASDVLGSQLTEETKNATIEMLKQQGITNAETLVTQILAQRKQELALEEQFETAAKQSETVASQNLTNATIDEINQLLAEGNITPQVAEQMSLLAFKKQWVNRNTINTSADIKNLAALAGVSSKLAQLLNSLALAKKQVEGGIAPQAMAATITSLEKQIDDYVNGNFGNFENPVYGGGSSAKSAKEKSSSSSSKEKEETAETLDWIETKLESISEKTSKLADAFDKTFTLSSTTEKFKEYLGQIEEEIAANNTAIAVYQDYLNAIGLSDDWIYKIQNGLYSIEEITDETLKDQISEYQTYYNKVVSCQETINSLEEKRLELENSYAEKIISYQEEETEAIEKLIEKREKLVSLKETFGLSASKKDLQYEQKQYKAELELIEKQNEELLSLQSTVAEGTDAWNTYQDQIESNSDSVQDLVQSMADLAASIANLPLDKLDAYLEKTESKNSLYDAKLENTTTASSKNKIINKQIKIAENNNAKTQATAETTAANLKSTITDIGTARKSDNISKTDSLYEKVKSYTGSGKTIPASLITKLGNKGYTNLVVACENYNAALAANETAQETAALTAEETKSQVAELVKQKFDNVQTQYENKQSLISGKANMVSSKMDMAVAKGYLDSENWYRQLIAYQQQNQTSLSKELYNLQNRLDSAVADGSIEVYSDEWWEMTDAIHSVTESLEDGEVQLQEYINALRQVKFDNFDYLQEQISRLTSEADYYIDLMSHKNLTDDNGLTEYGIATIGLYQQNYDTYLEQAAKYADMIKDINTQLTENPYDTNLIAQLQEYQDAQQQCILNAEEEKDAIVDLIKDGYDALYNSLSNVISKYLDLIDLSQDAYEYQKDITEQTENINSLKKKIAAYGSMSGNEEIASKLQQANKELAEAEENLQETLYEKYISDTEDILNDLLDELEEYINELAENEDELLSSINDILGGSSDSILATLKSLSNDYGTQLSTSLSSIWGDGYSFMSGITDIVTAISKIQLVSDNNSNNTSNNSNADDTFNSATDLTEPIQRAAITNIRTADLEESIQHSDTESLRQKTNAINFIRQNVKDATKKKDEYADLNKVIYSNEAGIYKGTGKVLTENKRKELATLLGVEYDNAKSTGNLYKKLKELGIEGFAKGSKHIDKDQIALTQEEGEEVIYRASDGAFLTPLGEGDMVFTNEMSKRLWEISQIPPEQLIKNVNITPVLPDFPIPEFRNVNSQMAGDVTIDFGGINMYGVNDPETFGEQLREEICKDGKTTKCLVEAVSSKQLGKGIGQARLYR